MMKDIQCTNCAENGHILRDCTHPITSFGIIAYKIFRTEEEERSFGGISLGDYPKIKMLLIQRKDTIGYTDFVRGKYNRNLIGTYFSEMTNNEQKVLQTTCFEEIWDRLWINHKSKTYRNEYEYAKRKFESKNIKELVERYPALYNNQEFGFPKGRRNIREKDMDCAIREFREETGYSICDYELSNNNTFVEDFTGTDNIRYKHVYYLAEMKDSAKPPVFDKQNKYQIEEIRGINFYTLSETVCLFRDYDVEKINVAKDAYTYIMILQSLV